MGCSASVQAMASEGAGRKEVSKAAQACSLPRSALITAAGGGIGALLEAAGQVAAALAAQLRERETVRQAVLQQATADLAAELARAAP